MTDVTASSKRPYRLWNPKKEKHVPHRYFKYLDNARIAALIETKAAKVGTVLELYNYDTGKLLGQYIRKLHNIEFWKERNERNEQQNRRSRTSKQAAQRREEKARQEKARQGTVGARPEAAHAEDA